MALGENGIGDADVSSFRWFEMSPPPPVDYVGSVASVDGSYYIVSNQGMWCWREWHTTDVNWWRYRLGLSAPCGP